MRNAIHRTYEIVSCKWLAAFVEGDDHVSQPRFHVFNAGSQREDGHDLRTDRDLEGRLAALALLRGALANRDFTQIPIIKVDDCKIY